MKRILAALLLVAFVAAGFTVVAADNGPVEIKFPARSGPVAFPHLAHQTKIPDCATCHHKGAEAGSCTSCHGVDPAAPTAKKAFHDQCRGCHKKDGGPTDCANCHEKP